MNRKDFFKKLGIGIGVAVVTPSVFATDIDVTTKAVIPKKEIETLPGLLVAEPYFPHFDGLDGFKDKYVCGCDPYDNSSQSYVGFRWTQPEFKGFAFYDRNGKREIVEYLKC